MFKYLLLLVVLAFVTCKKEEGLGGMATIKGTLNVQHLNCMLEKSGQSYPAMDYDIFIQYGDNGYIDDKVPTNPSGVFQFNYLTPGNYKIIIYSDDTLSFKGEKEITIVRNVNIGGKKSIVDLGEILTYKHVDIDDGDIQLKGKVQKLIYAEGTTIVIDTIPAQNTDVFLLLEGSATCYTDEKTLYDGSYVFNNLIPGNYEFYVLSELPFSNERVPIFVNFTITEGEISRELELIYVSDF